MFVPIYGLQIFVSVFAANNKTITTEIHNIKSSKGIQQNEIKESSDSLILEILKQEINSRPEVMQQARYLTNNIGPRLQGSEQLEKAINWSKEKLEKWSLKNVHLEKWKDSGYRWQLIKYYAAMEYPYYHPLISYPKAWTNGTNGITNVEIYLIDSSNISQLTKGNRTKLRNKIILVGENIKTETVSFKSEARRFDDEYLDSLSKFHLDKNKGIQASGDKRMEYMNLVKLIATQQNALAILEVSPKSSGGTLFVE